MAKARAFAPDVVLCDIGLPGMTGYEVARALRAGGGLLVAVSGYAQPEDVARAVEAGFDAHVAKPPDLGEIERLLASPLRRPAE
jgi:CheY-like chemotaxis protein